jgi:hypothetical protein
MAADGRHPQGASLGAPCRVTRHRERVPRPRAMRAPSGSDRGVLSPRFSQRHPPPRFLGDDQLDIVRNAVALSVSPSQMATIRGVLLSCPPVMPSGSGTIAPHRLCAVLGRLRRRVLEGR